MAYFDKYGVEFSDDRKTIVRCPEDFQGEYVIPNEVTRITGGAFHSCTNLVSVTIPHSVTRIEDGVFFGCTSLRSIAISDNITDIGYYAFYRCIGLITVNIPYGVIHVREGAFCDCYNIRSITIPDSIISIEFKAFSGCCNLKSIILPNNITRIDVSAFGKCSGLKEIIVPKGQKTRLGQMEGLKDFKDKIVEASIDTQKPRTWEEVNAEYRAYFEKRQKENPNIQNKKGGTPLEYPPFGIELSIQEYSQFKKEKHTIHSWMFWCKSGKKIHELARLYGPIGGIGLSTPRQGYYKVIEIEGEGNDTMLVCYYNLFTPDEFIKEEDEKVRIKQKPLFNKRSSCVGPIEVGDIIHVKSTELVEDMFEGRTYQAYKILWEFV